MVLIGVGLGLACFAMILLGGDLVFACFAVVLASCCACVDTFWAWFGVLCNDYGIVSIGVWAGGGSGCAALWPVLGKCVLLL